MNPISEQYFEIDFLDRSQCERIYQKYQLGKVIGKGAYGTVYDICKNGSCKYVLKVIKYDHQIYKMTRLPSHSIKHYMEIWWNEIQMHKAMIDCQTQSSFTFVPTIYDAWFCDDQNDLNAYFYMVFEKYDGNLNDFIKLFSNSKDEMVIRLIRYNLNTVIQSLRNALHHIHDKCSICINDIKLDNILFKFTNDSFAFAYADFGLTQKVNKPYDDNCKKQDDARLERSIHEFLQHFPQLM